MCILNKRETWSHTKKRQILQWAFRTFWRFFSHVSFRAHSKICPLTWMEDSNEQKCVQFSSVTLPRYPLTLALPRLITKAIVFSAIIQCIQEFLHWNISYICHVQIFDPFNKICIITITNFTNNKSICYNSQKVPSLAMLDWDWKNHVRPLYNSLYTQWWKNTDITQVLRKHKVHLWNSLRLWLIN